MWSQPRPTSRVMFAGASITGSSNLFRACSFMNSWHRQMVHAHGRAFPTSTDTSERRKIVVLWEARAPDHVKRGRWWQVPTLTPSNRHAPTNPLEDGRGTCQHDVRVQAAKGGDVAPAVPEKRCMDFAPIRGDEDGCSTSGQRLCSNWKLEGRQNSSKSFMVPRSKK